MTTISTISTTSTPTVIAKGMHGISAQTYHADPCPEPSLSNSIAKILLDQSPQHAWRAHPRLNPAFAPVEADRFDLGTAAHALLLEGDGSKIVVIDADDWRTKAAKEGRDAARAAGNVPMLVRQHALVQQMVEHALLFLYHGPARDVWDAALPERTITWQQDGVWCRARLDRYHAKSNTIFDYKTTTSAHPDAFARQIASLGYDLQDAFYSAGVEASTQREKPDFIFLAQEIEPPYACSLVRPHPAFLEIGMAKYHRAVRLWRECLQSGKWPAYPSDIVTALPPTWLMTKHEAQILEDQ